MYNVLHLYSDLEFYSRWTKWKLDEYDHRKQAPLLVENDILNQDRMCLHIQLTNNDRKKIKIKNIPLTQSYQLSACSRIYCPIFWHPLSTPLQTMTCEALRIFSPFSLPSTHWVLTTNTNPTCNYFCCYPYYGHWQYYGILWPLTLLRPRRPDSTTAYYPCYDIHVSSFYQPSTQLPMLRKLLKTFKSTIFIKTTTCAIFLSP